jgi:hypothetical protein
VETDWAIVGSSLLEVLSRDYRSDAGGQLERIKPFGFRFLLMRPWRYAEPARCRSSRVAASKRAAMSFQFHMFKISLKNASFRFWYWR